MRSADQQTIQGGITGFALLSAAGKQVFDVVQPLLSSDDRVLVACGGGNNGGDGLIVAKHLLDAGYDVAVALLGSSSDLQGDARIAFDLLDHPISTLTDELAGRYSVIIDAILGIGIDRPVSGELAGWIHSANASSALIISVDIPTGIRGDCGSVMGVCINAQHTVTFFCKKPAHVLYPGRHYCGQVHLRQIGINASVLQDLQASVYENAISLWHAAIPQLTWSSHKYTRGHVVVASGDKLSTGAARLAARAALRSGAGLVTLAVPLLAVDVVANQITCEMIRSIDSGEELAQMLSDERITSVVLGPGMGVGQRTRQMVKTAINSTASVILDADALTSFENHQDELFQCIAQGTGQVVMTPHAGEFKRLFAGAISSTLPQHASLTREPPKNDKIQLTKAAAKISGATVVMKGPDTVIANPSGQCVVNTNAPPWLATAGSGDVLAGTIAGWVAQGVGDMDAACIACWMHAEAAIAIGPGLIASDLVEQYPFIHQRLQQKTGIV